MIGFIFGTFFGGVVAIMIMALLIANGGNDDE